MHLYKLVRPEFPSLVARTSRLHQHGAGGFAQQFALAPGALDGIPSALGEGVGLHGHPLGGEVLTSHDDLVDGKLGLGDRAGDQEGIEVDRGTLGGAVELVELYQVVNLLLVPGSHRLAGELGQAAVQRLLPPLEARTGGPAGAGLLTPHPEAAGGTLPGGDTASLAALALATARGGAEVVEGEFLFVDGRLVGRAALPVEDFHGQAAAAAAGRGRPGGGMGGEVAGAEGGEGRCGGDEGREYDCSDHGWLCYFGWVGKGKRNGMERVDCCLEPKPRNRLMCFPRLR